MATTAKIIQIGNSVGIVLPKEILAQLRVDKGDTLYITEAPDGLRLTANNPALAAKLDALEQVMRDNRDVLKRLAE